MLSVNEAKVVKKALSILSANLTNNNPSLTSSKLTKDFLRLKLAAYEREVFGVLYLNNQHVMIGFEELFYGTIDSAAVHPREVVKSALQKNAAAVILAHNHPSGIAEPSQADIGTTSG